MEKDCIFCKIANGEIPSYKIYEDDNFLSFMDVNPMSFGHCLIIPKDHYENIYEMPEDLLSKLFPIVKKIAVRLKEVTGCDGMNIFQNNGLAGNQTVFHYHVHIRPRYNNDNLIPSIPTHELTEEERNKILKGFEDFTI